MNNHIRKHHHCNRSLASSHDMPGARSEEIEVLTAETTKPAPPHPQISSMQLHSNTVQQLRYRSIVSSTPLLANKQDLFSSRQQCASRPFRFVNDLPSKQHDGLDSSSICPANNTTASIPPRKQIRRKLK